MLWRLGDVTLTKVVIYTLPLDTLSDLELLRTASAYLLAKTNFHWIAPPLINFSHPTPHRTPTPQNPFGSHPPTFTPCSARTTTRFYEHVLTETTFQFQPALGISKIVVPPLLALLVLGRLKNKSYCCLEYFATTFASSKVKGFLFG